ncbi:MAG TPA: 2,3-bisphosphoglycerate-independent phosphoglycerate mutase [Nitrolancea sp.]|nr:2,3-bisphosphoglycerate-independent phosphoglycerate mutase [Nitrolancea sp.]
MRYRPVVLTILDGWARGPNYAGNAILAANTPTMNRLQATYPMTWLRCCGNDVGLPDGQMGNSEVGHINLGAGFVVYQWITRIDHAIDRGSFFDNSAFLGAIHQAKQNGSALHLIGLLGTGGVHSQQRHLYALLELARRHGVERVFIHACTDGRDTPPTSGLEFMRELLAETTRLGTGKIATITGRYYAMDRDRRWERTQRAFEAMASGTGIPAHDPLDAIQASYDHRVTDEFIEPIVLQDSDGQPVATINEGDAVIFFNFRADRARQLTQALACSTFSGFERSHLFRNPLVVTMTGYQAGLPVQVAFQPQDVAHPLARVLSDAGLAQFHTAETEKYAHVTYFFNGGREEPFPGEDRELIPSPKVPTYDLEPQMSAVGVTDAAVRAIESGKYDFVIINYANGDMVGHTGVFAAAAQAIETVDACVQRIVDATLTQGGVALVTADHGNADEMLIPGTSNVWTAHTKNPVPFILAAPEDSSLRNVILADDGRLANVSPTILAILGVQPPAEMTSESLIAPVATLVGSRSGDPRTE